MNEWHAGDRRGVGEPCPLHCQLNPCFHMPTSQGCRWRTPQREAPAPPTRECLASRAQRVSAPFQGGHTVQASLLAGLQGPSSWPIRLGQAVCPHTLGNSLRRFQGSGFRDETLYG